MSDLMYILRRCLWEFLKSKGWSPLRECWVSWLQPWLPASRPWIHVSHPQSHSPWPPGPVSQLAAVLSWYWSGSSTDNTPSLSPVLGHLWHLGIMLLGLQTQAFHGPAAPVISGWVGQGGTGISQVIMVFESVCSCCHVTPHSLSSPIQEPTRWLLAQRNLQLDLLWLL